MKKVVFLTGMACLMLAVSFAFKRAEGNGYFALKSGKYSTIQNETLNRKLEEKFINLIDKVSTVEAHFREGIGHYYAIYGKLEDKQVEIFVKTKHEDVLNETFTYPTISISGQAFYTPIYCYFYGDPHYAPCEPERPPLPGIICGERTINGPCWAY